MAGMEAGLRIALKGAALPCCLCSYLCLDMHTDVRVDVRRMRIGSFAVCVDLSSTVCICAGMHTHLYVGVPSHQFQHVDVLARLKLLPDAEGQTAC